MVTGTLKVLRPVSFVRQLSEYEILPNTSFGRRAPFLFIAFECALGVLILLNPAAPALALTAAVLFGFIFLTLWGSISGTVEDCGCYGDIVLLRPWQSVALDLVYLLLLGAAWLFRPTAAGDLLWWALAVSALAAACGYVLAVRNVKRPLDTSPLKAEKPWRASWLKDSSRNLQTGKHLIVFLGRECPYCKRWVPLLNVIEVQQDLPGVMAVLALSSAEVDQFRSEYSIHFPIARMQRTLFSLLTDTVPAAVLIEDGKIREKWVGEMPASYLERIRGFFEAVRAEAPPGRKTFGG